MCVFRTNYCNGVVSGADAATVNESQRRSSHVIGGKRRQLYQVYVGVAYALPFVQNSKRCDTCRDTYFCLSLPYVAPFQAPLLFCCDTGLILTTATVVEHVQVERERERDAIERQTTTDRPKDQLKEESLAAEPYGLVHTVALFGEG